MTARRNDDIDNSTIPPVWLALNSCKLNADSRSTYRRMRGRKRVPTRATRRRLVSASIVLISDDEVKKLSGGADDRCARDVMIRGRQSGKYGL